MVRVSVLGRVAAEVSGGDVDLGGPRQRAVLALLLAARGHVVSVDRVVDDLWDGEPPPRALGGLQAYVSNLRRALEPDRPPRTPARVLVSVPPGYAVHLDDDAVDAWRFERLLRDAAATDDAWRARDLLTEALGLWRGEAYAEFAAEPWAQPEVTRLGELRLVARERLAEALLRCGDAAQAAVEAESLAREHPLREEAWRLLALAHYAAGRQADALAALRTARTTLADELGIDPGPALVALEAAVLAQDVPLPHVAPAPAPADPAPDPAPAAAGPAAAPEATAGTPSVPFVGRDAELAALLAAADAATGAAPSVALVTAEAGGGKSALLDRLRHELAGRGWDVALGRCPESEGAPPAWAWVEALTAVAAVRPPGSTADDLGPLLGTDGGPGSDALGDRFRTHRAVARWLAADPGARTAILLDDVHVADAETLSLLRSLPELWPGGGRLLLVAAHRPAEGGPALDEALGALARWSPARVRLRGLGDAESARLVSAVCGGTPDAATLAALLARTEGNPFYLRESARLLASEGALVATSEVPEGVRDVLRRRFSRLPEVAVAVLRAASVLGRDVDVDVLLETVETDEDAVLDALEAGLLSGLLVEPEPGRLRFSHTLVRETLYQGITGLRRGRWHARVVDALERLRPGDVTALAHHYRYAVTPATAARALDVTVAAADRARSRFAWDAESALLGQALGLLDQLPAGSGRGGPDERVALLARRTNAQLSAGASIDGTATRAQAVRTAVAAGRDDLLVAALRTATVPMPWLIRRYGTTDTALVTQLRRLLAGDLPDAADRCRLLCLLAQETAGDADGGAGPAARQAVELARRLDDPALLCLALAAFVEVLVADRGTEERTAANDELLSLARAHGLVVFEVLALHHAVRGDFVANRPAQAEQRLADLDGLSRRHQLGQSMDTVLVSRAALAHATGRFEEALTGLTGAVAAMKAHGAVDGDAIGALGRVTVQLSRGDDPAHLVPVLEAMSAQYPGFVNDPLAIALVAAGDVPRARAVRRANAPLRDDFLRLTFTTTRATAAALLGEVDECRALATELLPFQDRLSGAGTAAFVGPPVAETLGLCALVTGDAAAAERWFARAEEVAGRWGNAVWAGRAALRREELRGRS